MPNYRSIYKELLWATLKALPVEVFAKFKNQYYSTTKQSRAGKGAGVSQEVWVDYEKVGADARLHQGDLVKFFAKDAMYEFGIVVTADCDLEKRKHSRLVTLVPLMSVSSIVFRCLSYDLFEVYKEKLGVFCKKKLGLDEKWDDPLLASLVRARLGKGVDDPDLELVSRIFVHDSVDLNAESIRRVLACIDIKWEKAISRFESQLKDRGDLLILAPPPDYRARSEVDRGAEETGSRVKFRVAWLRSLWQEPVGSIALRTSDVEVSQGMRVAQLSSPYRYRLTQMLGQVFSDIGLPDDDRANVSGDLGRI